MPFNVSKCQVMHLGKDNKEFEYFMGSHKLEIVEKGRDFGVQFANNLKPSRQCQLAYSKASRVLGMIGRTISYKDDDLLMRLYKPSRQCQLAYSKASRVLGMIGRMDADLLMRLYKSMIRPHCVSAWSQEYIKDSKLLKRVQQIH